MFERITKHIKRVLKLLFWLSLSSTIIISAYAFYHFETQILGYSFTNPIYDFVQDLSVWVYIVLCFIVFSLIGAFIFISLSHYLTVRKSQRIILHDKYYSFFTYMLTSYFLRDIYKEEKQLKSLRRKLKPYVKTKKQILALCESYLGIQETLTQDLSESFKLLFSGLKTQERIEYLIFKKGFDEKTLAMRMLSNLQIHTCDKQIFKYAKSENISLRTEAYAALIRLVGDVNHIFFIGEDHNLSTLDINIIVNAIIESPRVNFDYTALISSKNPQRIAIGLILISHLQIQNKSNFGQIIEHLGHSNDLINISAWNALLSVTCKNECEDIIIERFVSEKEAIKLNILKKTHHITSKKYYNYIASVIEEQSLLVKIEYMKMIFQNDFELLERFSDSEDEELNMAYREATCMYLQL